MLLLLLSLRPNVAFSRDWAACARWRAFRGKMPVDDFYEALKLFSSLSLQPLHLVAHNLRKRIERQRLACTEITRHEVSARRMRAENVLLQVLAVARLRRSNGGFCKTTNNFRLCNMAAKMRNIMNQLH